MKSVPAQIASIVAVVALFLPIAAHGVGAAPPRACRAQVERGVLPVWARGGFSERRPRMPHVIGRSGDIAAILFTDPLLAPLSPKRRNKILWVSRLPVRGSDLKIRAQRMEGARAAGRPVARLVKGGPGPSYVDLPAPGCWRLTLRWSGHRDSLDLRYAANR
jgi:hypothetical protein